MDLNEYNYFIINFNYVYIDIGIEVLINTFPCLILNLKTDEIQIFNEKRNLINKCKSVEQFIDLLSTDLEIYYNILSFLLPSKESLFLSFNNIINDLLNNKNITSDYYIKEFFKLKFPYIKKFFYLSFQLE